MRKLHGAALIEFNLKHPRDRKGRFIETGGVARMWGGLLVRVLGMGRGVNGRPMVRVEDRNGRVRMYDPGKLTMIARPDGTKPTASRSKVQKADADRDADPNRPNTDQPEVDDRGQGIDLDDDEFKRWSRAELDMLDDDDDDADAAERFDAEDDDEFVASRQDPQVGDYLVLRDEQNPDDYYVAQVRSVTKDGKVGRIRVGNDHENYDPDKWDAALVPKEDLDDPNPLHDELLVDPRAMSEQQVRGLVRDKGRGGREQRAERRRQDRDAAALRAEKAEAETRKAEALRARQEQNRAAARRQAERDAAAKRDADAEAAREAQEKEQARRPLMDADPNSLPDRDLERHRAEWEAEAADADRAGDQDRAAAARRKEFQARQAAEVRKAERKQDADQRRRDADKAKKEELDGYLTPDELKQAIGNLGSEDPEIGLWINSGGSEDLLIDLDEYQSAFTDGDRAGMDRVIKDLRGRLRDIAGGRDGKQQVARRLLTGPERRKDRRDRERAERDAEDARKAEADAEAARQKQAAETAEKVRRADELREADPAGLSDADLAEKIKAHQADEMWGDADPERARRGREGRERAEAEQRRRQGGDTTPDTQARQEQARRRRNREEADRLSAEREQAKREQAAREELARAGVDDPADTAPEPVKPVTAGDGRVAPDNWAQARNGDDRLGLVLIARQQAGDDDDRRRAQETWARWQHHRNRSSSGDTLDWLYEADEDEVNAFVDRVQSGIDGESVQATADRLTSMGREIRDAKTDGRRWHPTRDRDRQDVSPGGDMLPGEGRTPDAASPTDDRADRGETLADVPAGPVRGDDTGRTDRVLPQPGGAGEGADRSPGQGVRDEPERDGDRLRAAGGPDSAGEAAGVRAGDEGTGVPGTGAGGAQQGALNLEQPKRRPDAPRFQPQSQADLAPKGKKEKARANIEALRTLRTLQAENRAATPEEQAKLARWAGWGAIAQEMFSGNERHQRDYAAERADLAELLSPEEMEFAKDNAINAHYTDADIVDAVWDAVRDLGFTGGNVLEAGSGSGNFIGRAPADADMVGVELEPVTAAISQHLYPDATIRRDSYADFDVPDGTFDLSIGNVPFSGDIRLVDRRHNPGRRFTIHNHFIKKEIAHTRPGGLVAVITSSQTMDSKDRRHREAFHDMADLVGAIRMPSGAHKDAAGTDVVTDLLIFRRRMDGETPGDDKWVASEGRQLPDGNRVYVNPYWSRNPDRVLGRMEVVAQGAGTSVSGVRVWGDTDRVGDNIRAAMRGVVRDAHTDGLTATPSEGRGPAAVHDLLATVTDRNEGNITYDADTDTFSIVEGGRITDLQVPKARRAEAKLMVSLRDTVHALLNAEAASDADTPQIRRLRKDLATLHARYTNRYGAVSRTRWQASNADAKWERAKTVLGTDLGEGAIIEVPGEWDNRGRPRRAHVTEITDDGQVIGKLIGKNAQGKDEKDKTITLDATREFVQTGQRTTSYRQVGRTPPVLDRDPSMAVVRALDMYDIDSDPDGKGKEGWQQASIFTKRAVKAKTRPTEVDNPEDALRLVRNETGRVDVDRVAELLGTDRGGALDALGDRVYDDPDGGGYLLAEDYLSGDTRAKLSSARLAAASDARFTRNVAALEEVTPDDLTAEQIDARLGSSWIGEDTVQAFLSATLNDPTVEVVHLGGSRWVVKKGNEDFTQSVGAWGTDARDAYALAENLLAGRPIKITRTVEGPDGSKKSVVDDKATKLAQAKADELAKRFKNWLWEDPERAETLIDRYNDLFNSVVPREYDDSLYEIDGLADGWTLKPHQAAAVRRVVSERSTLLAHEVGAGKTLAMAASAMELRRLGLVNKPSIVVPNHMKEQFTREFLVAFPQAKVLAASTEDINTPRKRADFMAKVATGDWDAVVLTQTAFEKIPMSKDSQRAYLDKEVALLEKQLARAEAVAGQGGKNADKDKHVKKLRAMLIARRQKLLDKITKQEDKGLTFEQTGIDYLFVDEAHHYKNLEISSAIDGASLQGSDKATDLHMKVDYLQTENPDGRHVTFATATPVANTVGEAYTLMRYLRPDMLKAQGLEDFDTWASTFGEVVSDFELSPTGGGYRQKSRLARFRNAPEMLRGFQAVADVQTGDMLDLDVPDVDGGAPEPVMVDADRWLLEEKIPELQARAESLGSVDPSEDNMLKIMGEARGAALDPRLVGGPAPENGGKIARAAEEIAAIYEETKGNQYGYPGDKDREGPLHPTAGALQVVFCDLGTPGGKRKKTQTVVDDEGNEVVVETDEVADEEKGLTDFNVYDALKEQLVEMGVPAEKIAFMQDAKGNDAKKAELFRRARTGEIAVLVGSTQLMGVGTNVQDRAVAIHHMEPPWRPADVQQRDGRVIRQGNQNPVVRVKQYGTQGSLDSLMWQGLERKGRFISQVLRGNLEDREFEDIGEGTLTAAEMKAATSGDSTMMHKAKTDALLNKLEQAQSAWRQGQQIAEHGVKQQRINITRYDRDEAAYDAAIEQRRLDPDLLGGMPFTIGGRSNKDFESPTELNEWVRDKVLEVLHGQKMMGDGEKQQIGEIAGGFKVYAQSLYDPNRGRGVAVWVGGIPDTSSGWMAAADVQSRQWMQRWGNLLGDLEHRRAGVVAARDRSRQKLRAYESQVGVGFDQADELEAARRRAGRINALIEWRASGPSSQSDKDEWERWKAENPEAWDAGGRPPPPVELAADDPEVDRLIGSLDAAAEAVQRTPSRPLRNMDDAGKPVERDTDHLRRRREGKVGANRPGARRGRKARAKTTDEAPTSGGRTTTAGDTPATAAASGEKKPDRPRNPQFGKPASEPELRRYGSSRTGTAQVVQKFHGRYDDSAPIERTLFTVSREEGVWGVFRPQQQIPDRSFGSRKEAEDWALARAAGAADPDADADEAPTPPRRTGGGSGGDKWWRDPEQRYTDADQISADMDTLQARLYGDDRAGMAMAIRDRSDLLGQDSGITDVTEQWKQVQDWYQAQPADFLETLGRFEDALTRAAGEARDGDTKADLEATRVHVAAMRRKLDGLLRNEKDERRPSGASTGGRDRTPDTAPDTTPDAAPAPDAVPEAPPAPDTPRLLDRPASKLGRRKVTRQFGRDNNSGWISDDGRTFAMSGAPGQGFAVFRRDETGDRVTVEDGEAFTRVGGNPAEWFDGSWWTHEGDAVNLNDFDESWVNAERYTDRPGADRAPEPDRPVLDETNPAAYLEQSTQEAIDGDPDVAEADTDVEEPGGQVREPTSPVEDTPTAPGPELVAEPVPQTPPVPSPAETPESPGAGGEPWRDPQARYGRTGVGADAELADWRALAGMVGRGNDSVQARAIRDRGDLVSNPEAGLSRFPAAWNDVVKPDVADLSGVPYDTRADRLDSLARVLDQMADEATDDDLRDALGEMAAQAMLMGSKARNAAAWEKARREGRTRNPRPAPQPPRAPEPATPEPTPAPSTPARRPKKRGKLDEITFHEQYGNVTGRELRAIRKHNVSPADHQALVDRYGDDHAAIVAAITDPQNHTTLESGMFSEFRWRRRTPTPEPGADTDTDTGADADVVDARGAEGQMEGQQALVGGDAPELVMLQEEEREPAGPDQVEGQTDIFGQAADVEADEAPTRDPLDQALDLTRAVAAGEYGDVWQKRLADFRENYRDANDGEDNPDVALRQMVGYWWDEDGLTGPEIPDALVREAFGNTVGGRMVKERYREGSREWREARTDWEATLGADGEEGSYAARLDAGLRALQYAKYAPDGAADELRRDLAEDFAQYSDLYRGDPQVDRMRTRLRAAGVDVPDDDPRDRVDVPQLARDLVDATPEEEGDIAYLSADVANQVLPDRGEGDPMWDAVRDEAYQAMLDYQRDKTARDAQARMDAEDAAKQAPVRADDDSEDERGELMRALRDGDLRVPQKRGSRVGLMGGVSGPAADERYKMVQALQAAARSGDEQLVLAGRNGYMVQARPNRLDRREPGRLLVDPDGTVWRVAGGEAGRDRPDRQVPMVDVRAAVAEYTKPRSDRGGRDADQPALGSVGGEVQDDAVPESDRTTAPDRAPLRFRRNPDRTHIASNGRWTYNIKPTGDRDEPWLLQVFDTRNPGDPAKHQDTVPSLNLAKDIADRYDQYGDDYSLAEHGHRSRWTQAIMDAYDADKAKTDAAGGRDRTPEPDVTPDEAPDTETAGGGQQPPRTPPAGPVPGDSEDHPAPDQDLPEQAEQPDARKEPLIGQAGTSLSDDQLTEGRRIMADGDAAVKAHSDEIGPREIPQIDTGGSSGGAALRIVEDPSVNGGIRIEKARGLGEQEFGEIRELLGGNGYYWSKEHNGWVHRSNIPRYASSARYADQDSRTIRGVLADGNMLAEQKMRTDPMFEEYAPTEQQAWVGEGFFGGARRIVASAMAGTGKTTTLVALARRIKLVQPERRGIHLAFNKSVAEDVVQKMPDNVAAVTGDALAWNAVAGRNKPMSGKWDRRRIRPGSPGALLKNYDDIARRLGLSDLTVDGRRPTANTHPDDVWTAGEQAREVQQIVERFAISADDDLGVQHLSSDRPSEAGMMLLEKARAYWEDLNDPDGDIDITNSHLTKMWALTRPDLTKRGAIGGKVPRTLRINSLGKDGFIFFDEAQDINPVMARVIADQKVQVIYVGDPNQAIYGFRGASDEMSKVDADHTAQIDVTHRFGEAMTDPGNRFMQLSGSPNRVVGAGTGGEVMEPGSMPVETADAVLSRSNAGAIAEILQGQEAGRIVGVPKGVKNDLRDLVLTARWMREPEVNSQPNNVHEDLAPFRNWREFEKAVEKTGDPKLSMLQRIVDDYEDTALLAMVDELVDLSDDADTRKPDLVVSTAHKSKGLEWGRVKIARDFRGPEVNDDGTITWPDDEELRLAYVALTRAMTAIDPGSLAWVYGYTDPNGGRPGSKPSPVSDVEWQRLMGRPERDKFRRMVPDVPVIDEGSTDEQVADALDEVDEAEGPPADVLDTPPAGEVDEPERPVLDESDPAGFLDAVTDEAEAADPDLVGTGGAPDAGTTPEPPEAPAPPEADATPNVAVFADEIEDSLSTELTPEAEASREAWVQDSRWPARYLEEVANSDTYQDALQANLARLGFGERVTVRRRGNPRPGGITNVSVLPEWQGRGYGEDDTFHEFEVDRADIVGFGHPEEGELFVRLPAAPEADATPPAPEPELVAAPVRRTPRANNDRVVDVTRDGDVWGTVEAVMEGPRSKKVKHHRVLRGDLEVGTLHRAGKSRHRAQRADGSWLGGDGSEAGARRFESRNAAALALLEDAGHTGPERRGDQPLPDTTPEQDTTPDETPTPVQVADTPAEAPDTPTPGPGGRDAAQAAFDEAFALTVDDVTWSGEDSDRMTGQWGPWVATVTKGKIGPNKKATVEVSTTDGSDVITWKQPQDIIAPGKTREEVVDSLKSFMYGLIQSNAKASAARALRAAGPEDEPSRDDTDMPGEEPRGDVVDTPAEAPVPPAPEVPEVPGDSDGDLVRRALAGEFGDAAQEAAIDAAGDMWDGADGQVWLAGIHDRMGDDLPDGLTGSLGGPEPAATVPDVETPAAPEGPVERVTGLDEYGDPTDVEGTVVGRRPVVVQMPWGKAKWTANDVRLPDGTTTVVLTERDGATPPVPGVTTPAPEPAAGVRRGMRVTDGARSGRVTDMVGDRAAVRWDDGTTSNEPAGSLEEAGGGPSGVGITIGTAEPGSQISIPGSGIGGVVSGSDGDGELVVTTPDGVPHRVDLDPDLEVDPDPDTSSVVVDAPGVPVDNGGLPAADRATAATVTPGDTIETDRVRGVVTAVTGGMVNDRPGVHVTVVDDEGEAHDLPLDGDAPVTRHTRGGAAAAARAHQRALDRTGGPQRAGDTAAAAAAAAPTTSLDELADAIERAATNQADTDTDGPPGQGALDLDVPGTVFIDDRPVRFDTGTDALAHLRGLTPQQVRDRLTFRRDRTGEGIAADGTAAGWRVMQARLDQWTTRQAAQSARHARPWPGESKKQAAQRMQRILTDPQVAARLAESAALLGDTRTAQQWSPSGTPTQQRSWWRRRLPTDMDLVGTRRVRGPDGAARDRVDITPTGAPGEVGQAHVDALRGTGRAVADEVDRGVAAALAGRWGETPEALLDELHTRERDFGVAYRRSGDDLYLQQWRLARAELDEARRDVAQARTAAVGRAVGVLRSMGGGSMRLDGPDERLAAIRQAERELPADWTLDQGRWLTDVSDLLGRVERVRPKRWRLAQRLGWGGRSGDARSAMIALADDVERHNTPIAAAMRVFNAERVQAGKDVLSLGTLMDWLYTADPRMSGDDYHFTLGLLAGV